MNGRGMADRCAAQTTPRSLIVAWGQPQVPPQVGEHVCHAAWRAASSRRHREARFQRATLLRTRFLGLRFACPRLRWIYRSAVIVGPNTTRWLESSFELCHSLVIRHSDFVIDQHPTANPRRCQRSSWSSSSISSSSSSFGWEMRGAGRSGFLRRHRPLHDRPVAVVRPVHWPRSPDRSACRTTGTDRFSFPRRCSGSPAITGVLC